MAAVSFGPYTLLAVLGEGGMATVHLAIRTEDWRKGFRKLRVVKQIRRSGEDDDERLRKMFLDEAQISMRLAHPNVIATHEAGTIDDQLFLELEYLDGQPLSRILKRLEAKTPDRLAAFLPLHLHVLSETLKALHYAHELRDLDGSPLDLVHRDVSPHNVFITYDGHVKLLDFGIAKITERNAQTATGFFKGKVRYMAPEQPFGSNVDRRVDVFAIGVMLFEALAGGRLWSDDLSDMQVVKMLTEGSLNRHVATPIGDVPSSIPALAEKALESDPEKRPATAAAFKADLQGAIEPLLRGRDLERELGSFVADLFKDKRAELRAMVDRQLARVAEGREPEEPRAPLESSPALPSTTAASMTTAQPKQRAGVGWMTLAVAASLAAVVVAVASLRGSTPPNPKSAVVPESSVPEPSQEPAPPPPPADPPPASAPVVASTHRADGRPPPVVARPAATAKKPPIVEPPVVSATAAPPPSATAPKHRIDPTNPY
jgi:eukaryotic-like serine/threonine-protein kinase